MTYSGDNFTADLEALRLTGKRDLPDMATSYANATQDINATQSASEEEPTEFFTAWEDLRDEVQLRFKNSSDNLRLMGDAVRHAAFDYATRDKDGGEKIDELRAKYLDGPRIPDAPSPIPPEDDWIHVPGGKY